MVTTTTKTLVHSITRGNNTNSVNATITSTPGFNVNYFMKIPGILKLIELVRVVVALALVASLRVDRQLEVEATTATGAGSFKYLTYPREMFLSGEVYFLCAQTLALGVLCILLLTYAFHTVSSMIIPKATILEMTVNLVLALVLLVAGIVEIVQTEKWKYSRTQTDLFLFTDQQYAIRLAAGIISLVAGVVFLVDFAFCQKTFQGPKTLPQ